MHERERFNQDEMPPAQPGVEGQPGAGNLNELRRAGEDLLAAGDEAIRRALSSDSEAFLRASQQEGGQ